MAFVSGSAHSAPLDQARGSNLTGVRAYNERLILSLVRRHENLSKADISRRTGLSAQTVSVIVRALEADGLLLRMAPQRGRVGQPSIPLKIDPDGAYSIGLKIGRRSADLVFMDFVGTIRRSIHWTYPYPVVQDLLDTLDTGINDITRGLSDAELHRIAGLGVATPYELWNWAEDVGAPDEVLAAWRTFDMQGEIASRYPFPVIVSNDATAACGAELTFGIGREHQDFIYFFVGSFVGGGVVLGRSLFPGRMGNAGALGSMPIPARDPHDKAPRETGSRQLIASASLVRLEERLASQGHDPSSIFQSPSHWQPIGPLLDSWIDEAAYGLAYAIVASVSVIDFGAAIIDGGFPTDVRRHLVEKTREWIGKFDLQGLSAFQVIEGAVGANARAIGGASLPLFAKYLLDRDVLFKEDV
jgi:predicted NBD/HSP70 family sugar kinase